MTTDRTKIAVTGASGNVGGQVLNSLVGLAQDVVALGRSAPGGTFDGEHRSVDLDAPATVAPALFDVDTLFLLAAAGDPSSVIDAVRAAGVRRIVLLSSQGAGTRPEVYTHAAGYEASVVASGMSWTVLRPGGFHSNALQWAQTVREQRRAFAPFVDVALPTIDPFDVADVAVRALTDQSFDGCRLELTGPAATSPRERVGILGRAIGAPVELVELSRAEALEGLLKIGMPPTIAEGTLQILGSPTTVEAEVTSTVAEVLGRRATGFAAWAERTAPAFA